MSKISKNHRGKQQMESRDEQVRKVPLQEDILQRGLLQHFSTKTNKKSMLVIHKCQLKLLLLIMYFEKIVQK